MWTRRSDSRAADDAKLAGLSRPGLTIHFCPAFTITPCEDTIAAPFRRRLIAPAAPQLIVTSPEAARQLLGQFSHSPPAAEPVTVLTFSREVHKILSAERLWQVRVFAKAMSGAPLAQAIAEQIPKDAPLIYAGAAQPAFDFVSFLGAKGYDCRHWPIYATSIITKPTPAFTALATEREASADRADTAAVFCSPSAVAGFAAQWQSLNGEPPFFGEDAPWLALAIGETTAAAAQPYFARRQLAAEPTLKGVVAALYQLAGSSPPVVI